MHKIFALALLSLILPVITQAQKWKKDRSEYSFSLGATNFLGELGGRNQEGTNGIMDFEIKSTRFGLGFGYRYNLSKKFSVKGNLNYLRISGNDNLTQEPARFRRQLNFRSDVIELSGQLEYILIHRSKDGHRYKIKGARGQKGFGFEVYALAGIGGIKYDPKGDNGSSQVRLAPLNTEGQGLVGGPDDYSGYTVVIPYGLGIRRTISKSRRRSGTWSVSFELTMRKTFSDYLDDVSGVYYDSDGAGTVGAGYTGDALYFSDPSNVYSNGKFGEPQQRGESDHNDAYMLGMFSINYRPLKRKRHRAKF